jgi:cysteinyl-tRNA synthetase
VPTQPMKIYNNLTRSKEEFRPITAGKVSFYSCGPTTYDYLHVGNGMALVVGDMIHRVLNTLGYDVTFVRNFTDVDDKIIQRAKELKCDALTHSRRFTEECIKDMDSLGMLPATHTPRVSETIAEIIKMVERLLENEAAYQAGGEVLFSVKSFNDYGKLSKKVLDELEHGARVAVEDHKRDPADFVLWKPSTDDQIGWESPWGRGRPGWHIECSAMAAKFLGESIDLHHGGIDLMFPHHENEIAQSEAAHGKSFANYWCHNEFLSFGSDKMSKSLGNVITIREFCDKFGGEILRQILLSTHYRSRIEWSDQTTERALRDVERIHRFVVMFDAAKERNLSLEGGGQNLQELVSVVPKIKQELANDFNVVAALSHFFSMIRLLNREFLDEQGDYSQKRPLCSEMVLAVEAVISLVTDATGLIHPNPQEVLARVNLARKELSATDQNVEGALDAAAIEQLLVDRKTARSEKNWGQADQIRTQLDQAGVAIKDNPDGTTSWSYK